VQSFEPRRTLGCNAPCAGTDVSIAGAVAAVITVSTTAAALPGREEAAEGVGARRGVQQLALLVVQEDLVLVQEQAGGQVQKPYGLGSAKGA
jgi:hypothetical protein